MSRQVTIKPLSLGISLLLVGVPAVAAYVTIHFVVAPLVERSGEPFLVGYLIWWIGFMALYLIASLVAYRLEAAMKNRGSTTE